MGHNPGTRKLAEIARNSSNEAGKTDLERFNEDLSTLHRATKEFGADDPIVEKLQERVDSLGNEIARRR